MKTVLSSDNKLWPSVSKGRPLILCRNLCNTCSTFSYTNYTNFQLPRNYFNKQSNDSSPKFKNKTNHVHTESFSIYIIMKTRSGCCCVAGKLHTHYIIDLASTDRELSYSLIPRFLKASISITLSLLLLLARTHVECQRIVAIDCTWTKVL